MTSSDSLEDIYFVYRTSENHKKSAYFEIVLTRQTKNITTTRHTHQKILLHNQYASTLELTTLIFKSLIFDLITTD